MTPTEAGQLAGEKLVNFGLIEEERRAEDYVHGEEERLGGSAWVKIQPVQIINGDKVVTWVADEPEIEYQRKAFETNACVSFSGNNVAEYLLNHEIKKNVDLKSTLVSLGLISNEKVNFSDRRTAKGSGTDPNVGNSVRAVDDYIRNYLFCPEGLYPFSDTMGRDEYYGVMSSEVADFGKKIKPLIEIETKYLSTNTVSTPEQMWEGLQFSPIWVSVDGFDQFNNENLIEGFSGYTHRITIRAGVYGKYWEVHDHYLKQFKKYVWTYPFGNCKIMQINPLKKTMSDFIKVGSSIAQLAKGGSFVGKYLAFDTGDELLAIHGAYANAKPRETLDSWPPNYIGRIKIILNP